MTTVLSDAAPNLARTPIQLEAKPTMNSATPYGRRHRPRTQYRDIESTTNADRVPQVGIVLQQIGDVLNQQYSCKPNDDSAEYQNARGSPTLNRGFVRLAFERCRSRRRPKRAPIQFVQHIRWRQYFESSAHPSDDDVPISRDNNGNVSPRLDPTSVRKKRHVSEGESIDLDGMTRIHCVDFFDREHTRSLGLHNQGKQLSRISGSSNASAEALA